MNAIETWLEDLAIDEVEKELLDNPNTLSTIATAFATKLKTIVTPDNTEAIQQALTDAASILTQTATDLTTAAS